ncbi:uncharacterized protein LOC144435867 [Glandiceps talaboti]
MSSVSEENPHISPEVLMTRFSTLKTRVEDRLHLKEVQEKATKYAQEHPLITLFSVVAIAMSSVPIIGFICFAVATICASFVGFVFVEGTLLTIAGVLLSGVLVFVGLLALGFSALLGVAWFTFNLAMEIMQSTSKKIQQKMANQGNDGSGGVSQSGVQDVKRKEYIVDADEKDI